MAEAKRDQNHVTVALFESSDTPGLTLNGRIDELTGRILVSSSSGGGDVVGPGSSTDDAVVRWDGTSGTDIQNSTIGLSNGGILYPFTNDAGTLGDATHSWSDLFGATGFVFNIANGNWVATHSSGILTVGTGELRITTPGTNSASVPTLGSTSTFTSKTLTSPVINVGSDATGDIYYRNGSGLFTRLPIGTASQVLAVNAGATAPEWITNTAAVPTLITVANEATDTTCFLAFFTAATGDLGPKTNVNMTFNSNTGVVTFASSVLTTTDINGGTVDGTVIGGSSAAAITGTTITGTVITGNSFVPNSSSVPSNGMYLPAANTLGWAINSAAELQLTATALSPAADGGNSLGTTALGWQNLFANTGFVLNIENGDWVATHTAGILTIGTGELRITTAGTNTASVPTLGSTSTFTNKRITARVLSAAAYTTNTGSSINGDTQDLFSVTAQTGALLFNDPTGTPTDGQKLIITVASSTTSARALTWGTAYLATTVALPTTTEANTNQLNVGFMWSAGKTKWLCVAVA